VFKIHVPCMGQTSERINIVGLKIQIKMLCCEYQAIICIFWKFQLCSRLFLKYGRTGTYETRENEKFILYLNMISLKSNTLCPIQFCVSYSPTILYSEISLKKCLISAKTGLIPSELEDFENSGIHLYFFLGSY
jgi:hypothetical protein